MKKLALTSLLAFMAVSGAHAANVIDGNPLYMPKAGHFYSVTTMGGHTHVGDPDIVTLGEDFGYGISDKLAINVGTSFSEGEEFDGYAWNNLSFGATLRAFQDGNVVADIYGDLDWNGGLFVHNKVANLDGKKNFWFDKDFSVYTYTVGGRIGYMSDMFSIAGHLEYAYRNAEMFNWGDYGLHTLSMGLDGQFVIDSHWNLVAGVEYTGITNDNIASYTDVKVPGEYNNAGVWNGYFGVNYNIDATKYVGVGINGSMDHWKDNGEKGWDFDKGFGFGARFGIDF